MNTKVSTISKEIPELKINNATKVLSTPVNNDIEVKKVVGGSDEYSIKIGTAFSGLGCPEYSLKKLGINHTNEFVIENNKFCQETLKINHAPKQLFSDITNVDTKTLSKTDLYVWGSPCQDLSMSNNNREGLKGGKSKFFFNGYQILKDTMPKYSIFENVQG
jgi:DNA (cytosine-5)-methyltransferase 1